MLESVKCMLLCYNPPLSKAKAPYSQLYPKPAKETGFKHVYSPGDAACKGIKREQRYRRRPWSCKWCMHVKRITSARTQHTACSVELWERIAVKSGRSW
eukprot:1148393-Pelagomonas_calceolata.AAC.1